ncbi:MAG: hypothetical protein H7X99_07200 [Saprospiraceae bacterium]|nr:hypothetical protein [Saprospiraceae bacterium]
MSELKWSYDEFLAFLLIYIANVDMDFSEEEKALISKNVGEPTYSKMVITYDSMSDYKAYETILSYKEVYYPTPEQKAELIEKMKDLFDADADFNIMEKELLHFLDKMM